MLGGYVVRHRRGPLMRLIAHRCHRFLLNYKSADNYDLERNGERRVLEILGRGDVKTVFDVGANHGSWTAIALEAFPKATVHAFEIMPLTFEKLKARHADNPRVVLCDHGLADHEGEARLRYFPEESELTTLTQFPHPQACEEAVGRITTGDAYMAKAGVKHVDFLKLDVEGAEEQALQGFEKAIGSERIDVVQFEYGKASIVTKFMLRDFHLFFEARGYRVGKIYPNYVDFRDYEWDMEDFIWANFLAVRTKRADLIAALS
ncbi:MAG: FkbM family methyltransferase [Planctomycetota bacterium]|nr:FkbM family methyltransferase [Planctomycetota bacterium]